MPLPGKHRNASPVNMNRYTVLSAIAAFPLSFWLHGTSFQQIFTLIGDHLPADTEAICTFWVPAIYKFMTGYAHTRLGGVEASDNSRTVAGQDDAAGDMFSQVLFSTAFARWTAWTVIALGMLASTLVCSRTALALLLKARWTLMIIRFVEMLQTGALYLYIATTNPKEAVRAWQDRAVSGEVA